MDRPLPRVPRARLSRDAGATRASRCSASGTTGRAPRGRSRAPSTSCCPTSSSSRDRPSSTRWSRSPPTPTSCRRWPGSSTPSTSRGGRRSTRSPSSPRSGSRCAGRSSTGSTSASPTCPRRTTSPTATPEDAPARVRAGASTPSRPSRRRPATTTPSAGGRTPSSTAARRRSPTSPTCARRWRASGASLEVDDDARREAFMRKVIRAEMRGGRERIAVVCGAYHAPALDPASFPPVSRDNALLSKLPEDQGRRDVGAVELRAPVVRQRLRRRGPLARAGTTTSSSPPTTRSCRRGSSASPAPCAARTSTRRRPRSSRRPGSPTRWPPCGAARRSGWPS